MLNIQKLREVISETSQKEFAERSSCSQGQISQYLSGEVSPQLSTIYRMAKAAEIPFEDLVITFSNEQNIMVAQILETAAHLARADTEELRIHHGEKLERLSEAYSKVFDKAGKAADSPIIDNYGY